jgi:protein pelota
MKVLRQNKKKGEIELLLQHMDDSWHLYNILEKGDLVSAVTYRTKKESDTKKRAGKGEKEKMYVTLEVQNMSFQKFTDRLRIHGTIVDAPEDIGAHHTLYGKPGAKLKIQKEWRKHQIDRLDEAVKASSQPMVAVLSLDEEKATLATIHYYGVEEVAVIESGRTGKMYESKTEEKEYYGNIFSKIKHLTIPFVIIGPGYAKEHLANYLKEKKLTRYIVEGTGHAGMVGVHEALKRGILERISGELQMSKEIKLVEALLDGIAKNNPIAYGKTEVKKSVEMGATREILITSELIRDEEKLLEEGEKVGAKIHVISIHHEGGEKLASIGGIAAFLRYAIS